MTEYFKSEYYEQAKRQRKKVLAIYFIVFAVYLAASGVLLGYYVTLTYQSPKITVVKLIEYPLTAVFIVFSFIYLGIAVRRVNKFYAMCVNIITGLKETSEANFFEYDETLTEKDGVDMKSLVFLEWNKYKKGYYERKVLVFYEKEFPEIPEGSGVRFITQGNVLVSYEILDETV